MPRNTTSAPDGATPETPAAEPVAEPTPAPEAPAPVEEAPAPLPPGLVHKTIEGRDVLFARLRYNGPERQTSLHVTAQPILLDPIGFVPAAGEKGEPDSARSVVRELLLETFFFAPSSPLRHLHGKPKFSLVDEEGRQLDPAYFLFPSDFVVSF